jgi:hypothetical protein
MLWMLVRGVVHERDGQSAGACHGGCLASPKHLTQMLFVYRSDRCPALDCAFQPVLECLHQTKHWVFVMAHLTVVSTNPTCPPSVHAAHDLRNIMASIGLHLETLQRLSGPSGAKAADAAYALLTRSVALCNRALDCTTNADNNARRRRVDLVQTARQIADLLAPSAPKEFSFDIGQNSAGCVLADPDDVFRILFNLMNNAVSVARGKANAIKSVTIRVTTEGTVVTMQVSDDGPGLPVYVQSRLFRTQSRRSRPPRRGYGLAIARELAERNGGTLKLAPSARGASFELKLAALVSVLPQDGPRSLGRRAAAL